MGATKRGLDEVIEYIITWLCYGDEEAAKRVAYTADEKALEDHDVIIVPNGNFGNHICLPDMSKVVVEQPAKGKAIIRTDIVYNTFFFISRAEETYNTERDNHDRFLAQYSLLGQNNRLQIPSLDEHARLLLKLLNLPMPSPGFGHIYLTHDIDAISQYRSLRGALGGIKRGETKAVLAALKDIHNDPLYTFPWLMEQDARVPDAEVIYFVKRTSGSGYDYPQYNHHSPDAHRLRKFLEWNKVTIGWHSSYYGVGSIEQRSKRRDELSVHRSHYLNCSIENMRKLVALGITDDYTMGFADQAGFRLQTSRAVLWIDPERMQLTELVLHPLIIMDVTLSSKNYMALDQVEATYVCQQLIDKVRMHNGDLCLLWHNTSINQTDYHKSLYPELLLSLR